MVNLISYLDAFDSNVKPCINVSIDSELLIELDGIVYLDELVPSKALQEFWKHSSHSDTDWEIFKSVYNKQLLSGKCQAALQFIADMDEIMHRVNVIDCEPNSQRSHRNLLAEPLRECDAQVFLK